MRSRRPSCTLNALPSRRGRALLLAALLCAMVLLQALGLVHRTAHHRTAHHHAAPAAQAPHAAGVAQPWLKALFSGHTEGAECVLYDQLGQADALAAVPTVVLPDAAVIRPEPVHPAWNLAHQAAGFLARGPPSTPV